MKSNREQRGQFVIIAVMLVAIMIVSIGTILHGTITYYKHEPWEEYSTLIGDIEINTRRVVELSLADYTKRLANNMISAEDKTILSENLESWKNDLKEIYPSDGVILTPDLLYGGIETPVWNSKSSRSTASAKFTLNITSIGLEGYSFDVTATLTLGIISTTQKSSTVNEMIVTVESETGMAVEDLRIENFRIENATITSISRDFPTLGYKLLYSGPLHTHVEVWDQRGIHVVGLA